MVALATSLPGEEVYEERRREWLRIIHLFSLQRTTLSNFDL